MSSKLVATMLIQNQRINNYILDLLPLSRATNRTKITNLTKRAITTSSPGSNSSSSTSNSSSNSSSKLPKLIPTTVAVVVLSHSSSSKFHLICNLLCLRCFCLPTSKRCLKWNSTCSSSSSSNSFWPLRPSSSPICRSKTMEKCLTRVRWQFCSIKMV